VSRIGLALVEAPAVAGAEVVGVSPSLTLLVAVTVAFNDTRAGRASSRSCGRPAGMTRCCGG
jgi:hypothetical protein